MTRWVWREAMDSLRQVMPGSSGFLLDQIAGIDPSSWGRFRPGGDDDELGEQLLDAVGTQLGDELFVVTDASWGPDVGPFMLPTWHLNALIRDHLRRTGEPFFAADVVILSPDAGIVVALHQAGLIAVARGTAAPREALRPLAHFPETTAFADWDPPLEWVHLFGESYPDTAITLPSGRVVTLRWFETDPQVSFIAPTGDFQASYRGPLADLDEVYAEFCSVLGEAERGVVRLPSRP